MEILSQREKQDVEQTSNPYLLDLIEICRILHQIRAEYIFFLRAYKIFTKSDHALGPKQTNKPTNTSIYFKKIEIILKSIEGMLSDNGGIKLKTNYLKKFGKLPNISNKTTCSQ